MLGRLIRPADRLRPMGWLAMLSCAPLIFCQVHPPAPMVALLWALAGAGGAYQLAAAAAFVRALPQTEKARAFAVAQSGLLAAQVAGLLTAGAVAKRLGPPAAVALAGLIGLVAAAVLATDWIRRHAELLARLDGAQLTSPEHELTSGQTSAPTSAGPARHAARITWPAAQRQARAPGAARRARPARRGPASCCRSS